jgi:hypothetical protein
VLLLLHEGVYTPNEISEITDIPIGSVSYYVKELVVAGSIELAEVKKKRNVVIGTKQKASEDGEHVLHDSKHEYVKPNGYAGTWPCPLGEMYKFKKARIRLARWRQDQERCREMLVGDGSFAHSWFVRLCWELA